MTNNSRNDLKKIKKIINLIVSHLEQSVIEIHDAQSNFISDDFLKNNIKFIIGEKETIISVIIKLTNLLIKIIPLEIKIDNLQKQNDLNAKNEKIDSENVEILKRYVEKIFKNKNL